MKTRFELKPVPPFRLDLTAWALRRRPENMIDAWDGSTYSRVLVIDESPVMIEAVQAGSEDVPILRVHLDSPSRRASLKQNVSRTLEHMLGLKLDLSPFYAMAERAPEIRALARRFRGVKPPRFPSLFEALANGIACQQLSLAVGITLLNRFADRFGMELTGRHAFPDPRDVATAKENTIRKMGYSGNKTKALTGVARSIVRNELNPDEISSMENETDILSRLEELPGVGPWTSTYVLLRGLGHLSVFPSGDIGARRNLSTVLSSRELLTFDRVRSLAAGWHPFGGFIYFHLLLNSLAERGLVA